LHQLNAEQKAAVLHTDGPLLVLAGAGSGKTRVVTSRIAHLLNEREVAPSEILAVTFTNKAASEMRERVVELVGKKRAAGLTISTFHSFCLNVLRKDIEHLGYRKNFSVSGEADSRTLLRRVLDDMDGVHETFSPAIFREEIGRLKGAAPSQDSEKEKGTEKRETATQEKYRKWVPSVYEAYQSALRAANALDFDDLLAFVLRLWDEHPEVLKQYQQAFRYVMVDEYQDTNQVQYQLLKRLVAVHQNICVVGDDDQSIYGWRGAQVDNILNFHKQFPGAEKIHLAQNYRSTETILDAANALISNNRGRHDKKMVANGEKGRPIDRLVAGDEEHEAKLIVEWLEYIQSKTGAEHDDFVVLYRSNTQSRPIEIALRMASIPYKVYGGQDFYDRAEVRDILAYLKLLTNPRDEASFLRAVNMPRRGIGDVALHVVHDICREQGISFGKAMAEALKTGRMHVNAELGVRQFLALMDEFRGRLRARDSRLSDIVRDLVGRIRYREEIDRTCKSMEVAAIKWENVETVIHAVEQYEETTPEPLLSRFLDESALCSDDKRDNDEDDRRRVVSLMTVHSAKGLEFPFVFIAGVEDGLFPHAKSMLGRELEEERRLFYVALTRAQRHVTLFEALSRTIHGREKMSVPSRFLKELPNALVKTRIHAARDMVVARVDKAPETKTKTQRRKARSS